MTGEVHSIIRSYGATVAARVIVAQIIEPLQAELATAKALLYEIAHLCENCRSLGDAQEIAYGNGDTSTGPGCEKCWVEDLKKQLATANDENKRLKDFARPVIEQECWSLFPQDGGDLQELAEELGLIVPDVATQEDVDNALYKGYYEVGDNMYKFAKILKE